MANFGIGLAQGFQLGTQLGQAMRQKRMREEFETARADKQFRKYTPEQGALMRREAEMVDEFGNPLYEFSIEPGSTQYTRREVRYPNARAAELPQMSLADAESEAPAPRSLGTMYRTPTGTMGLRGENFTPDTTGQTEYDVDDKGFRQLSFAEAQRVYADPRHDPNLSANAQYDRLFGPQPRKELSASGPEYSPALLPPEQSRVQQRLGREYGDSMMYSPEATQYLGETYGAEGLTPTQQRAALMNRYADIISKYESPVEGEKFRSLARAEERAEETYGLTKQMAELGLGKARREEAIATQTEAVYKAASEFQAENPGATIQQVFDHVKNKVKPSAAVLNKVIAEQVGVEETELKAFNIEIEKIIKRAGGSVDTLIDQYNKNPLLDPTTNLVKRKDKDGRVVLDFVSAEDPSQVLSSQTFRNDTEARDFLVNSARNPVTAGEMLQKSRYVDSQIAANMGLADYRRTRGLRDGGGGGFRSGAVQPFIDKDGNTVLLDVSKLPQRDGVIQLPEGLRSAKVKPSQSAEDRNKQKKLDSMLKSDEWDNAKTPAQQIKVMRKYGITPADMGREDTGLSDW